MATNKKKKREVQVTLSVKISKTVQSELVRFCNDKNRFQNAVVEDALIEYFNPFDKENHEKNTKMQLSRLINMLIGIGNKLDMSMLWDEEYIKTFYRNIPALDVEDDDARIALNVRIIEGHDNFVGRVLRSAANDQPNILSAFNIDKTPAE